MSGGDVYRSRVGHKEDVMFRCCGRKEELCPGEMELPFMCKEDMEFAMSCTREG
jgi:hypothetical protein